MEIGWLQIHFHKPIGLKMTLSIHHETQWQQKPKKSQKIIKKTQMQQKHEHNDSKS
jgi:hypothetical protein